MQEAKNQVRNPFMNVHWHNLSLHSRMILNWSSEKGAPPIESKNAMKRTDISLWIKKIKHFHLNSISKDLFTIIFPIKTYLIKFMLHYNIAQSPIICFILC